MQFSDAITLVNVSFTRNALGDQVEATTERQVFANRQSIRQSEFYQAAVTGLRPELMFEVWSSEYRGEQRLSYDGRTYNIIRTYNRGEITELVCSGLVVR